MGPFKRLGVIRLPQILYFNTAILLLSSLTSRLRALRRRKIVKRSALAGIHFDTRTCFRGWAGCRVAGTCSQGALCSVKSGKFFFLLSYGRARHSFLGGVLALFYVVLFSRRLARKGRSKTAVGVVAMYWHFMDALWIYVLVLLFVTVQR